MRFCCVTWESLVTELAEAKVEELSKHVTAGIPKSVFAPVLKVLANMDKHCPVCGTRSGEEPQDVVVKPKPKVKDAPDKVLRNCSECGGKGVPRGMPAEDGEGIPNKCTACLGTGKITKSVSIQDVPTIDEVEARERDNERKEREL